ncbi:hypothetical protein KZZ52_13750 [Dactylosporangium sp. AC04546]|uniref:hypothetical protein n=1 Tax=Dactylosporangium sp. AC04546 TaxID=2862460 RepID=UPI001EDF8D67|nr:hypothetical protein [Dactylosporangium sp. AC04546]WVK86392.1 hypothetical protein KZZ52_13750 [Dactylosporangium sp. AC04546]
MATEEYTGRSGRVWGVRRILQRPGYLRPPATNGSGRAPNNVDMVRDRDEEIYGALRRFRSSAERRSALSFLALGSPTTPVVLDIVDDARLPAALVTSWAPGVSERSLDRVTRYDDLGLMLAEGGRFSPAQALRSVVALGQLLDAVAGEGFTPIELSPDHLIYNRGSVRLVGIGRHLYRPAAGQVPDAGGMSLPTALLIGEDYPGRLAGPAAWRKAQIRALLRLLGWMSCGLAPAAWGRVHDRRDLGEYLAYAGFSALPELHEGELAAGLEAAARVEERAEGLGRLRRARAVVIYDDRACRAQQQTRREWVYSLRGQLLSATITEVYDSVLKAAIDTAGEDWVVSIGYERTKAANVPQGARIDLRQHYRSGERIAVRIDTVGNVAGTGLPPVGATIVPGIGSPAPRRTQQPNLEINPEAVRLGLMVEHGPDVIGIAAIRTEIWTMPLASMLSAAGWILVEPNQLATIARRLAANIPDARYVIAGRSPLASGELRRTKPDVIDPDDPDPPLVASRPASTLPYLRDVRLDDFRADMATGGGRAQQRRTFAAGWAGAWAPDDSGDRVDLRGILNFLTEQFGGNTELLLRVRLLLSRPAFHRDTVRRIKANVERAAPILSGMPPAGPLREDLMTALIGRSPDDLFDVTAGRLLPTAPRLAEAYDPNLTLGGRPMDESLRDRAGIERLGLFGRMVTAMPGHAPHDLAELVSALDDATVQALRDIPAPSLQHLAGRLASGEFRALVGRIADAEDLDLLDRYTPEAWEILLDGMRGPEQIGNLGLGWALIAERDRPPMTDPRAVLDLAAAVGREPRYVVRTLLDIPAEQWPTVWRHPELAAAWLREFDSLDIDGVVAHYPDATALVGRLGARVVRAGKAADLSGAQLAALSRLAQQLGLDIDDVVNTHLRLAPSEEITNRITSAAALQWLRHHLGEGKRFIDCVRHLAEHPGALRVWAVDGPRLRRRVLGDLLGTDGGALELTAGEQRELLAGLAARPGLGQLAGRAIFPRQRVALATMLLRHPQGDRWPVLLGEPVQALINDEDPAACLDLVLGHGMTVAQARAVRGHRQTPGEHRLLRALGPLLADCPDERLRVLSVLASRHGIPCAVTAAIVAQRQPQAPAVVDRWGPAWLPLLAGPDGAFVAETLGTTGGPPPSRAVSDWFLTAGRDGLNCLRQHGERLLRLVATHRPPVADVRMLDALLAGPGWPVDRLYPLVVRYGLPASTWPAAARRLAADRPDSAVIVELLSEALAAPE